MRVTHHILHVTRKAGPLLGLATLAALYLSAMPAAAQTTVFSSFGPGNSFNSSVSYTDTGPSSPLGTISFGAAFSPSATGALSAVTVAFSNSGGTDDAHLYLTDALSKLGNPVASLESFVFAPLAPPGAVVTLPSALHPVLTTGQTYYLYALEPGNELNAWNTGLPPVSGTVVRNFGVPYTSIANQSLPAFSIQEANATAVVPESSGLANLSAALLALGLSGLVMAVKKRKTAP